MQVKINGKIEQIAETTLLGLLQSKKTEPQMVSVEINSVMLNRADYPSTILKAGDEIEFLYFMGGGGSSDPGHDSQPVGLPEGARTVLVGAVQFNYETVNICL